MSSLETSPWLKDVQLIAEQQATLLDGVVEALQQAQSRVPEPSRVEIQAIRDGRQPLDLPAYFWGYLQRVILAVEDAACDLRSGTEDEALIGVPDIHPTDVFMNAIEASLEKPGQ